MKTIVAKIDNSIFEETEKILSNLNIPQNRYINEAIDYFNKVQKRQLLEKRLTIKSKLVQKESIAVLNQFANIDYED